LSYVGTKLKYSGEIIATKYEENKPYLAEKYVTVKEKLVELNETETVKKSKEKIANSYNWVSNKFSS